LIIVALLLFISYAFLRYADIPVHVSIKSCATTANFEVSSVEYIGVASTN
jgi:hypothetical protein